MNIDKELIVALNQACNGQEEGFNTLYKRTYKCVYFRAKQLFSKEEDVQDLIQEVYIEVYRSIGNLNNINSLYPWLKQITFHMATKMYRKKTDVLLNEEEQSVFDVLETEDTTTLPELSSEMKATSQLVAGLINELPDLQKTALIAYYYDEFNVNNIAQMMECSEGTIKSRLNYARQTLKLKILEKEKREGILLHSLDFSILYWTVKYIEDNTYIADDISDRIYDKICESINFKSTINNGYQLSNNAITEDHNLMQSTSAVKSAVKSSSLLSKIAAMGIGAKVATAVGAIIITSTLIVGGRMILGNTSEADTEQEVETIQYDENNIIEDIDPGINSTNVVDDKVDSSNSNESIDNVGNNGVTHNDQLIQVTPYTGMIEFNYNDECIIKYPTEWGSSARSDMGLVYFYDDGKSKITLKGDSFTDANEIAFSSRLERSSYSYYELETESGQKLYVTDNIYPDHVELTAYLVDQENMRQYELNAVMLNDFYEEHRELYELMAKSMSIIAEGYVNNNAKPAVEPGNITGQEPAPDVNAILKSYYDLLINPIMYEDELLYSDNLSFSIVDVNHDGIPELLLDNVENFGMAIQQILYTYYNGVVVPLGGYGHGTFQMYKSGSIFSGLSVSMGYTTENVYQINEGKLEEVAYRYSDVATGTENPTTTYYVSDVLVDKAVYEAFIMDHTGINDSERESIEGAYTLDQDSIAKAINDYNQEEMK